MARVRVVKFTDGSRRAPIVARRSFSTRVTAIGEFKKAPWNPLSRSAKAKRSRISPLDRAPRFKRLSN